MLSGAAKSAAGLVGNLLDLVSRNPSMPAGYVTAYQLKNPGATPQQAEQAFKEGYAASTGGKIAAHVQDAANWLRQGSTPQGLWENVGAVGEQALEYIGTDGLLKLVGAGAKTVAAGSRAAQTAEDLRNAQQVTQTLAKNPRIAGLVAIGLKASKDAAMLGGQTYAHTEDPTQAAEAAATGGVLRAGAEGLSAAGRWVGRVKPKTLNVAGEEIPALASQVNEQGKPIPTGAGEAPKIAAAQQAGAQRVIQNVAQKATASALDRLNQTRPVFEATQDPARMLEAGEDAQPFTFRLEGPPTAEEPTGEIAHPAAEGVKLPGNRQTFTSESAPAVAEGTAPRNKGTTGADITTEQVRPTTQRQAKGETVGGGGALETTDPAQAENWLRQIEEIQESPIHKTLSQGQQDAIEEQRKNLSDQLGLYHASPYSQRLGPVDPAAAVDQVRTWGDAADQIQAAVKPVYATLDQASNGDFVKLNGQAKQALKVMRSATSVEAYDAAEQRYREASGGIDDLITRHAGDVNREDYQAAKLAWRASSRMNELHAVFERMMNGITSEESEQGFTRTMTGRTKQLQNYLDKGENRAQIEELIGKDGITNLKQITELLAKPGSTRSTADVLRNTVKELGRHTMFGGGGGAIGGAIAQHFGLPAYEGAITGVALTEAMREVMRQAAINPRVGQLVDYAARNGVDPKVYAPLIARAIAVPTQEQQPPEEGAEQ